MHACLHAFIHSFIRLSIHSFIHLGNSHVHQHNQTKPTTQFSASATCLGDAALPDPHPALGVVGATQHAML
jgi:hypothetical protein